MHGLIALHQVRSFRIDDLWRADRQQGWLTSFQIQATQLAWGRQKTGGLHFSKPVALYLMLFCIFINPFQWSKPCYSQARKGWKIVLGVFLALQRVTVNYCSSEKLESKQRPHYSNSLVHISFLGYAEQSCDRQTSSGKHPDPRLDLNSETVWSVDSTSGLGFSALCCGVWDRDTPDRAELSQGSSTDLCSMLLCWCTQFKCRCSTTIFIFNALLGHIVLLSDLH